MSEDQFTRLFKYMQDEFGKVRNDIEALRAEVKADINSMYGLLDANLRRSEIDEQERLAMNAQLDRHETWFKQLAKNTNTKLSPRL